ncbi:MAG: DUF721 domain-containing protein [Veillonella sp.]|nr:DUF721 domain-containing protein [Veillonella sp.]
MSQFEKVNLKDWAQKAKRFQKRYTPEGEEIKAYNYEPLDMTQLAKAMHINSIRTHWNLVVGPSMAKQVRIESIEPPVLTLVVHTSMWMQEITMRKRQLLADINKYYGENLISDIKVRMYKDSFVKEETSASTIDLGYQPVEQIDFYKIPIPSQEVEKIDADLASISNPKLRDMARTLRIQNWKKNQHLEEEGYHRCALCGKWIKQEDFHRSPYGPICQQCHHKRYREHVRQIKAVLKEHPTLKYEDMGPIMRCTMSGFNKARQELIYYFMDKIHYGSEDPHHMYMLAQLITFKSVDQLDPQFVANLCAKYRSQFLDKQNHQQKQGQKKEQSDKDNA